MDKIAVAGAGGFIGHYLVNALDKTKYEVVAVRRKDFETNKVAAKIRDCVVVVNLTGESVAGIWTRRKKEKILKSRIETTGKIVKAINEKENCCRLFIQVSAVGIYDHHQMHDENSTDFDEGFIAGVVKAWEEEVRRIQKNEIRIVILRLGVVLNSDGGMFPLVRLPFRVHAGIGVNSQEAFPFIHMADLIEIVIMVIENENIEGLVNVVSPEIVTIRGFFEKLAEQEGVPVLFWLAPRFLFAVLGESASMITEGQRVVPKKLLDLEYEFLCPELSSAFKLCLSKRS